MTHTSERCNRWIKKDRELERLFEQAAKRRKILLQQRNLSEGSSQEQKEIENITKYILKPLRSSDNSLLKDTNDNQIELIPLPMHRNLQRSGAYYSHQNLPETNLDNEETSVYKIIPGLDNNNYSHEDSIKSTDNLNKSGHHNPSFVTYSSSSDDVDISINYCQFIPAISSSSTNTTTSSHYSRTDNSTGVLSSFDPSSSDPGTQSIKDVDRGEANKRASVVFYPSGSPLISHKYQGSPVVRIDNKLRAGEADFLVDRPKPPLGKPPLMPRHQKLHHKPMISSMVAPQVPLSHSAILIDHHGTGSSDQGHAPVATIISDNASHIPASIMRRTKKRLLEEHMRKRFSVGDYSTRPLIEWENNLTSAAIEYLSMSGDLPGAVDNDDCPSRKLSSQSEVLFPFNILNASHNFSSELNIVHCSSSDSFKDVQQVSFSLKQDPQTGDSIALEQGRLFKRSNFIQRSMNDIAAALRNVRSEKAIGSKRSSFMNQGMFKKRDSTSSDFLYSIPPFARQHMPPDISGATRIITQATYQNVVLPSSTPNLIAELDPTFHERYPSDHPTNGVPLTRNPLSKRNRSYRLSFIENAHTVTTKKLTSTSATTSPLNAAVPRFVQPRRRIGSCNRNSTTVKKHESPKMEPRRNSRSRNSRRFSCAQQ